MALSQSLQHIQKHTDYSFRYQKPMAPIATEGHESGRIQVVIMPQSGHGQQLPICQSTISNEKPTQRVGHPALFYRVPCSGKFKEENIANERIDLIQRQRTGLEQEKSVSPKFDDMRVSFHQNL